MQIKIGGNKPTATEEKTPAPKGEFSKPFEFGGSKPVATHQTTNLEDALAASAKKPSSLSGLLNQQKSNSKPLLPNAKSDASAAPSLNIAQPKVTTPNAQTSSKSLALGVTQTTGQLKAQPEPTVSTDASSAPDQKTNAIPTLAGTMDKYVLSADAIEKLPEEVAAGFAERMQDLVDYIDTPELHNALASILKFTQDNPAIRDILREDDVALFVRAARNSYGLTVTTKTANKAKKTKSDALVNDIAGDLADLVFTV